MALLTCRVEVDEVMDTNDSSGIHEKETVHVTVPPQPPSMPQCSDFFITITDPAQMGLVLKNHIYSITFTPV